MKHICTKECLHYVPGGYGERYCTRGFFDERSQHNKPRLDDNYAIIMPPNCDRPPRGPRPLWR